MSSDEEKYSLPVVQNDSSRGSSVSSNLQEEYEELLHYAIVTPNIEPCASQSSHPKGELVPDVRISTIHDILHSQGNNSEVRETAIEVGKGCDFHISSHSKTDESSPVLSPRKPSHPVMDFFSSHLLADSSSPATNSSHTDAHEILVSDFLVSDENLQKMENVLDLWSSGLKTNIISELSKWRLNFIDWHRMEMRKEKEKHAAHLKQLCNQINELKELQKTFEISIGRKDEVISSLSHAIGKQKEKIELMRTFFHWRIGHVRARQDVYEGKLADQYYQRTLLKKVWKVWRSVVQKQWKDVVERACQARAEEVCIQISNDYEAKVAMLSGALENAKAEIQRMQHEKEHFEDSMKKAFMRGVCALNLEAMTIFQNRNDAAPPMPLPVTSPLLPSPPAAVGGASATAVPSAASMTSTRAASASSVHVPVSALGAGSAATAASEEMQTIPQATAAKYPRTIHPESSTSASRSLGTRSAHTQSLTSVHSIKVVD
ncbi:centrosomal protein POC5 isoform X3 [Homo sapiens]|uniref:centrosomal protein POC5 isoform X3 n=1 Tax=Homo sapiens TaxID=9606 RepID=UPI001FB12A69|nr:centrosomal protein POC5 isoform X3 [Homo sapiens]XP_054207603.1 centrosomal protein POC5 isoform X3 [Homo sapiens]